MLTASPPAEFTTTDPEEAHQFLRAAYVDNAMRITGSRDSFRMRNRHHDLGAFAFSSLSHTMAVEHVAQPLGYLLLGRVQVGQFECESDGSALRPARQDVFLVAPPDRPYIARWETMRLQLVRIDMALVGEVAGADPASLRFTGTEPVSDAAGRHLGRTLNYVAETLLTDPTARTSELVVGETGRLLAASALEAFPHTGRGPARVRAASLPAVRRGVEFITTHAHTDIGVADIAAAARVTPSALSEGFRRHLSTTPLGYLRRVRLAGAREELRELGTSRGARVPDVAARWGFGDTANFRSRFRAAFGEDPAG